MRTALNIGFPLRPSGRFVAGCFYASTFIVDVVTRTVLALSDPSPKLRLLAPTAEPDDREGRRGIGGNWQQFSLCFRGGLHRHQFGGALPDHTSKPRWPNRQRDRFRSSLYGPRRSSTETGGCFQSVLRGGAILVKRTVLSLPPHPHPREIVELARLGLEPDLIYGTSTTISRPCSSGLAKGTYGTLIDGAKPR